MKFLIATNNQGKVKEFQRILIPFGIEVVTPKELGLNLDVEENGSTFAENAKIKAEVFREATGLPTIADDSGLCIDALNGEPGVNTARYGGADLAYPDKFRLIFNQLEGLAKEDRTARFICSICCILDDETIMECSGEVEGWIGFQPMGDDGFGYDPIFYVNDTSFAQMGGEEKDKISHRGRALKILEEKLEKKL